VGSFSCNNARAGGRQALKAALTLFLGMLGFSVLLLFLSGPGTSRAASHGHLQRVDSFDEGHVIVGTVDQAEQLLIGDLDRDGWPDAVAGWPYVYAWRNGGDPFSSGWVSSSIGWSDNVAPKALVDLDGDGDLDLVVSKRRTPYTMSVWENDGSPFSGAWSSYEIGVVPAGVRAVAVGDVDRDGAPDLVVGVGTGLITPTSSLNSIYVWRYEGSNPFASTWISAEVAVVTYTANSLVLGDLNNDDWLDIVIGTNHAPPVGTPDNPVPQEEWPDVYQLRAFRNDGAPFSGGWTGFDVGRDPTPWTLQIAYHGFWGASIYAVAVADFDDDGYLDIATGGGVEGDFTIAAWRNDGTPFDGIWQLTAVGLGSSGYFLPDRIYSISPADINGDGLMDLVSGSGPNEDSEVNYWENSGIPFSGVPTDTYWVRHGVEDLHKRIFSVKTADLDRDGDIDITALAGAADWTPPNTIYAWENQRKRIQVEVTPDNLPADGISTAVVTAMVEDEQGHAVTDGTVVTFTITLGTFPTMPYTATTVSGAATATLTAGTELGVGIVTARVGGALDRAEVRFAGLPATVTVAVSPDVLPADGVSTAVVTATVGDERGHAVADGTEVAFTATLGTFPTMPYTATTVGSVATAIFTAGTELGTGVVTATAGTAAGSAEVEFVAGPPATVAVEVTPGHLPADGVSEAVVTAIVSDAQGYVVLDGTEVVFTATLGAFPTMPYTVTTVSGTAIASLTAGTEPGTAAVWAYSGMVSGQATVAFRQDGYLVFVPAIFKDR
jgi:hypothetical protein